MFFLLFNTVRFQMSPQMACLRGCIVTLVAFIWLFSTVRFQMLPQIVCTRGCKVTLIAFVWLFSTVCFQMCPQIACPRGCKVTLVAFIWLSDIVSLFLKDFPICIIQNKVINSKSFFHRLWMLYLAQMFALNWVKSEIHFWSITRYTFTFS